MPHDDMLAFGTYEILVMNEQVNASGYTNYASPESKLILTIFQVVQRNLMTLQFLT